MEAGRRTSNQGRCKACLVDSTAYLVPWLHRYIELNPVHAAMVAEGSGYAWSSMHANALGKDDPLVFGRTGNRCYGE